MPTSIAGAGNNKIGTCPHGLPMGACPICNGMGGGGGAVRRNSKPDEMSWNECYAIGQMMKAQKLARKQTEQMFVQQIQNAFLEKILTRFAQIRAAIVNAMPAGVVNALSTMKNILLTPLSQLGQKLITTVQSAFSSIAKFVNTIKEQFINIADKLAALFGEAKAAIEKKLSEKFKDLKKKVFNLFGLASADNEEDDEAKKIEEMTKNLEMTQTHKMLFIPQTIEESEE